MNKKFISLGNGCSVNIDLIDQGRTHYDARIDKVILYDNYGNKYMIEKQLVKRKLNVSGLKNK